MDWLIKTVGTSVGKKLLMALTGLAFCGFLTAHLAGNLTVYGGADAFNSYAEHLHSLGPLITVAELVLLALFLVHVLTGLVIFFPNLKARPQRYAVDRSAGGRTVGSRTMPYTGVLILLFIIYHLMNFTFVDKSHTTIFAIVAAAFANPLQMFLYIAAVIVVAVHVSHGFWSLFQTFGLNHPKYMPTINTGGLILSLVFGLGFGFLPIYIAFIA
jgi:succinate dehydrogenase / fumarate reductase, cytochrome b subunit